MTKKMLVLILGCLLPTTGALAEDDALARAASVPLGERAAFYLQSYLNGLNILERSKAEADPLQASLFYNPGARCIVVLTAGPATKVGQAQAKLERLERVFLAAAPKVKEAFGLDLGPADFRLVYFSGPLAKTLLTLEDGKPVLTAAGTTTPAPR